MRIYVLGCGGMLGDYVHKHFSQRHNVFATDLIKTEPWLEVRDVRDYRGIEYDMKVYGPDVVMNLAAVTDLERCEAHPQEAMDTNAGGSANCAALAAKHGAAYVYISTAGIFDGSREWFNDDAVPVPMSVYGRAKYLGELEAQSLDNHIVLRCGWQMGSGRKDKKFVNKIWKQIRGGARDLYAVKDKAGTPTYVKDFTLQIDKLLREGHWGVYNAVCDGSATRYDVAEHMVHRLGLDIRLHAVDSDYFKEEYHAARPASEKLIPSRLRSRGLYVMRHWKEALDEYLREPYFSL